MQLITRKSMLRPTDVEYGDYAMNHVLGCSHGCTYPCYAYLQARRFGLVKSMADWMEPKLVSNTLELLDKELPRLKDKIKNVHLCFTTDPFMAGNFKVQEMSILAMERINSFGIPCTVLTKGVLPRKITSTLNNLSNENLYGISLVTLNNAHQDQTEPFASGLGERIDALKHLHASGCKTWVSIEPYPTPNIIDQYLPELLSAIRFVDRIVFGRAKYCKEATAYKGHKAFYNKQAQDVRVFCDEYDIECIIKKGTETEGVAI